jgi:hypothetical protein
MTGIRSWSAPTNAFARQVMMVQLFDALAGLLVRPLVPPLVYCFTEITLNSSTLTQLSRTRQPRPRVHTALTLDIGRLLRQQVIVPGCRTSGTAYWTSEVNGQPIASVAYEADLTGETAPFLRRRSPLSLTTAVNVVK